MAQVTRRLLAAPHSMRAAASAVPRNTWLAIIGLVALASVGLSSVIGAGVDAWRGGIAAPSVAPRVVVAAPHSAVVVVPTPHTSAPHPAAPDAHPPISLPAAGAGAPTFRLPASVPAAAPPIAIAHVAAPVVPGVVAQPRLVSASTGAAGNGRHLGWVEQEVGAVAAQVAGLPVLTGALATVTGAVGSVTGGEGHPQAHLARSGAVSMNSLGTSGKAHAPHGSAHGKHAKHVKHVKHSGHRQAHAHPRGKALGHTVRALPGKRHSHAG